MYRLFDFILSLIGLIIFAPILLFTYLILRFESCSPIFQQKRVGYHKKVFVLFKFRTMRIDTASIPSHLVDAKSITSFGGFLRRTKLDELPQLWNVLKGDMSLVGPRPCLITQSDLINEREALGVFNVRPGITGIAQINNIDMSTPKLLAKMDAQMTRDMSICKYFQYIFLTAIGRGFGDIVS